MPAWLGIVGTIVGITVFFGAVVIYFQGSKDKGTIETLERNNHALTDWAGTLEARVARLTSRVESLERENDDLRTQRPSAEAIAEIGSALVAYIADAQKHNAKTLALLMAIATTLGERNDTDQ